MEEKSDPLPEDRLLEVCIHRDLASPKVLAYLNLQWWRRNRQQSREELPVNDPAPSDESWSTTQDRLTVFPGDCLSLVDGKPRHFTQSQIVEACDASAVLGVYRDQSHTLVGRVNPDGSWVKPPSPENLKVIAFLQLNPDNWAQIPPSGWRIAYFPDWQSREVEPVILGLVGRLWFKDQSHSPRKALHQSACQALGLHPIPIIIN